jgi:hypothetical protein
LDPACLSNITLTGRSVVASSLLASQGETEAAASTLLLAAMDDVSSNNDDIPGAANAAFSHTLPRSRHSSHHHHHVSTGTTTSAPGGERSTGTKSATAAAGPRLTTCQLPPCCSNPSFETFVSSRAAVLGGNGPTGRCGGNSCNHNSKQQQMSVVDILRDLRSTAEGCPTGNKVAAAPTVATTARSQQPPHEPKAASSELRPGLCGSELQQQRHVCKPVICPKEGFIVLIQLIGKGGHQERRRAFSRFPRHLTLLF